jgi:secreted trypsin-like serine protease
MTKKYSHSMIRLMLPFLLILFSSPSTNTIIIRHDVAEQKYIDFAKELPVTSSLVQYNSTDLAGTLIAPEWVLSAAHVAETIAEDHKLIVDGASVGIKTIIIHPGWEENGRPDLALIKLNKAITSVSQIRLYKQKDEIGKQVIVAGIGNFGTGKTGVEGNPGIMRAATNIVDGSTSDSHFLFWEFNSPESEKVTELEGISGPGDSSGPAIIKVDESYYIAGISAAQSTSATGGVEGLYGVTEYYTRVSAFVDWIEQTIKKL